MECSATDLGRGYTCSDILRLQCFSCLLYKEHAESFRVLKFPLAFIFVGLPDFPTLMCNLLIRQICGKFIISALLLLSQSMTSWLVYHLPWTKIMTSDFCFLSSVNWWSVWVYLPAGCQEVFPGRDPECVRQSALCLFFIFSITNLCCLLFHILRHLPHICYELLFRVKDKFSAGNSEHDMMGKFRDQILCIND